MAKDTQVTAFDLAIYEIFPRMFVDKGGGAFKNISGILSELKSLGINTIWLMPIHPVGIENRKGASGSPYAVRDYFEIDSKLGSKEDYRVFVKTAHSYGIKVFMDMVMNHCACDSVLVREHPDWILKDGQGKFGRKIAEWEDVYDLDYHNQQLVDYMVSVLRYWVEEFDIDGYRCDVADLVPLSFWLKARHEISMIKPDFLWLSEGYENEMYRAFDITYDYDGFTNFLQYLEKKIPLMDYISYLNYQHRNSPKNAVKLRFLENHDQLRISGRLGVEEVLEWTAFMLMLRGVPLIYNGQEYLKGSRPDIFDYPPLYEKKNLWFRDFLAGLLKLRSKSPALRYGEMELSFEDRDVVLLKRFYNGSEVLAIFNFGNEEREIAIRTSERSGVLHYMEHLSDSPVHLKVRNHEMRLALNSKPLVLSRVIY
ncbi:MULTISPECIES: alpha-amylase family glycosyl hydrolase [Kosmotoga]|jgi:alpha-amylase|uniref:Alpha amylase catalytic region n=2 Tax=Kosmotoga TaxID=651456 RepID=C5CET6_KOSOT|nr:MULTISPECIES: alpha-amylase family glycosyl hydrolase [Kosmotoga]ACR80266.1 alpha amylase catalytic region [Kosmotoga olearia TBF 19.5.1]MDI3523450.1 hypothetical protein [Kosmotoga sp.]MDK2953007.1 hypothetical protein [Kosmotoga sp.]